MDSALGSQTIDFLSWMMTTVNQLQPPLFPLQVPSVTTVSHPSAVQVCWNEVPNALSYAVFESSVQTPPAGLPFATVAANSGANSNSVVRPNLNDTTMRYYFVQAVGNGNRSALSAPAAGSALSSASAVIPISQSPINQGGVGGGVGGGGAIKGINSNRYLNQ